MLVSVCIKAFKQKDADASVLFVNASLALQWSQSCSAEQVISKEAEEWLAKGT